MSAEVETMMFAGALPWHGLGKQLEGEVTSKEAIIHAGLDWEVEVARIVSADEKRTAVDNYRMTRRMTDNAVLGIVPKNYVPIQNRTAFALMDTVVGEGKAVYHTAGSLQGGSKVFLLAKLPGVMEIGKLIGTADAVERYVLLSNPHDGGALQMLFTPVRVVCSNTLGAALQRDSGDAVTMLAPRVKIRHTKGAEAQMREAGRIMKAAHRYYETFGNFAEFIYRRQVNTQQVTNVLAEVFPPNKKKEVTGRILEHRGAVLRLFDEGKGHDARGVKGSAWALWNAFTEYADHTYALRGAKEAQDRSYSVLMGGARGLKNRATKSISELVS